MDFIKTFIKMGFFSLIWDGRSMLEISVEPKLREKLFGMCGNFNGDPNDDFRSAKTNQNVNLEEFTESWRLGDQAQCTHRPPKVYLTVTVRACSRLPKSSEMLIRAEMSKIAQK